MAKIVKTSKKPSNNTISSISDLAEHIKYKRTSEGLSLEEAASLCNISAITLSKLEKGFEGVRFSTVLTVSKMFGLKLEIK